MTAPPPRPRIGGRELLITLALVAVVAFGLAGLAVATGWEETLASLSRLGWGQVAVLLGLSLANYLARTLRWHLFCRTIDIPVTLAQSARHYLAGFALTVTPGRVGELIRLRWIWQETGTPVERAGPVFITDRASDLASIGVLIALAVAFGTAGLAGGLPVAALSLLAAVIVTREGLARWAVTTGWRMLGRWPRLFGRLRRAARSLGPFSDLRVVLPTLALGMAGWFAEGVALWLLLGWMGADLGLWTAVGIFLIATLTGGATGSPGGLGGAEAAMVALLGVQGVPLDISVPATLVIRLTTLWFAIAIGVLVFPAATRGALRGRA